MMDRTKISEIRALVFVAFLWLLPSTASAAVLDESGDLTTLIVGDVIPAMPGRGSEAFVVPTLDEIERWREVVRALLDGDADSADQILQDGQFPYDVVRFTELSTGQVYLMLREHIPVQYGWGTYVFTYSGQERYPMIVESPHPLFDIATGAQGAEYFRDLGARAFLLAGTHRCANESACGGAPCPQKCDAPSDCARGGIGESASTMFQVVHEELALHDPNLRAVQLHGNSDPTVPALVISNGVLDRFGPTAVSPVSERICELGDAFFSDPPVPAYDGCHVYGRDTTALGANKNPQGHFSNQVHPALPGSELPFEPGYFLHIEQKRFVRIEERARMRNVLDAVFSELVTLNVSPTSIPAGDQGTVTWTNIPSPTSTDWIGIYVLGAPDSAFIAWFYVSCTQIPGSPVASGSCPFDTGSLAPGTYNARLFSNDSFNGLAISNNFTVTASIATLNSSTNAWATFSRQGTKRFSGKKIPTS